MSETQPPEAASPVPAPGGDGAHAADLRARLAGRSVVLVGLMGAGKTTLGRRLAARMRLPFRDADVEIETAAGMPISDIFASYGEAAFRDVERRVIARLLDGDPLVLATGGGAFMDEATRRRIGERGVSVWLKADHATLMRRVIRRTHRPLLRTADPEDVMRRLMDARYPAYGEADLTVESRDGSPDRVVGAILAALDGRLPHEGSTP